MMAGWVRFTRYLSVVEVLRSEPSAATYMEMEADKLQQHLPDFTRHYAEKNGGKLPERIVIYRYTHTHTHARRHTRTHTHVHTHTSNKRAPTTPCAPCVRSLLQ